MNSSLRKQWTAALRSGNYKQCFGKLQGKQKYCAVGVLADVLVKRGQYHWRSDLDCPHNGLAIHGNSCLTIKDIPELDDYVVRKALELNDRQFKTFNEIADYIDEYYSSERDVQSISA